MSTIVTRAGKGSALSWVEADANFTNLNTDKLEVATAASTYATQTSIVNMVETTDIGVSVQAYSANLSEYAAVNPTTAGLALLDDVDAAAQRTTLGLGTAATQPSTAFASSGSVTTSGNTMNTGKVLGRTAASSGAVEEISIGAGLSLTSGTLDIAPGSSVIKAKAVVTGIATAALSYTRSGTTVTVTLTAHPYQTGMIAEITSATDTGVNAVGKVITYVSANTFSFQTTATGANGTLVIRSMVLSSTNITSVTTNGTGDRTITFTAAMADTFYTATATTGPEASGARGMLVNTDQTGAGAYSARTTSAIRLCTRYGAGNDVWDTYNLTLLVM